jgi:hypothetical protein
MGPFRVLQISIVVLMLFGSTWLVRVVGMAASPPGSSTTWLTGSNALAGVLRQDDNDDNDDGDNDGGDNGDADNGDEDNDDDDNNNNSNNNNSSDEEDNDNDYDDENENFGDLDFPMPSSSSSSSSNRPPEVQCSTPGQDAVFTSHDGKVTLRVFASTPRPVRVEIFQVIDFLSAPLPPGTLVGLLAYEIRASYCDTNPLPQLPAEANLGIHYNDIEATGLDENRFVIGHLDMSNGTWTPVAKRGNDPTSNFTSATIIDTGFYMVWETR